MNFLKKSAINGDTVDRRSRLRTALQGVASETAGKAVTMLALNDDNLMNTRRDMSVDINAAYENKLDEHELSVATMVALQAANPSSHGRAAQEGYRLAQDKGKDYSGALALSGRGGSAEQLEVNFQSYDTRNFDNYKELSIDFAVETAKADAVTELFFPSLLLPADSPALRVNLRSTIVQRNKRHTGTGITKLDRKNLAHAYTDPTILENNATTIIPVVAADGSNEDAFISSTLVAPYDVEVDGELNKTAPIKINREVNLFKLAAPGTFAPDEAYDLYDQLDQRVVLDTLDFSVTDANGGTPETSQLSFKVYGLPKTNFHKAPQEDSNEEFMLRFNTDVITVNKDTLSRAGVAATALAGIEAGVSLRLRIRATATLSLNTSNFIAESATVEVIGAFNDAGPVAIEGALADTVNDLTFTGNGVELADLSITNSNRSTTGLWIDTTGHTRQFLLGTQSPLYHPAPKDGVIEEDIVESLIEASRAVTTNRGISAIRNHFDSLSAYLDMGAHGITSSEMFPGAADEITPYHKSVNIDVLAKLNSISTHEKGEDIRSLFSTIITHYVAQMINRSNIITARQMYGAKGRLPVVIATDPEIAPWLMISGDADFLGRMVDYKVEHSVHPALKGKIFVSFGADTSLDGLDPCGFGRRGFTTELISQYEVQRGNSKNQEVSITPRELHAAVLPVGLEFNVTNLTEAVEQKL